MAKAKSLFPSSMSLLISRSDRRAMHWVGSSALAADGLKAVMVAAFRDTASLHSACTSNGSAQRGPLHRRVHEIVLRTFRNTRMLASSIVRHISSARVCASS